MACVNTFRKIGKALESKYFAGNDVLDCGTCIRLIVPKNTRIEAKLIAQETGVVISLHEQDDGYVTIKLKGTLKQVYCAHLLINSLTL